MGERVYRVRMTRRRQKRGSSEALTYLTIKKIIKLLKRLLKRNGKKIKNKNRRGT